MHFLSPRFSRFSPVFSGEMFFILASEFVSSPKFPIFDVAVIQALYILSISPQAMNNPFFYRPDPLCDEAFRELLRLIERMRNSEDPDDQCFCRELDAGKMLGVLIAEDLSGVTHTLYAFSGQAGGAGFYRHGFVGPVFDYLQPDGYFKTKEAEISLLNREIAEIERSSMAPLQVKIHRARELAEAEMDQFKEECRISKARRDAARAGGSLNEQQKLAILHQSQFEKAELRRMKKRLGEEIEPLVSDLAKIESLIAAKKQERKTKSEALQNWLFNNFTLLNGHGESTSLSEIFAQAPMKIPPSGAGECCAPKLLHEAFLRGWKPVAIAEYWHGRSKDGEVRIHGEHYPACRGKCLPILTRMLEGVEVNPPLNTDYYPSPLREPRVLFENEWFCVVDKPSGMLSIPGKSNSISLQEWLERKYGQERDVKVVHRLDQDTSGLLVATFGAQPYKLMQSLFAKREVRKSYVALLDGDFRLHGHTPRGRINLPLSPDLHDRPRQHIDFEHGKEAVTDYEFTSVVDGRSRVIFHPLTGRTHQLRIHAASANGLSMPIVSDRLYGHATSQADSDPAGAPNAGRLLLHAWKIEFVFPIDGQSYRFEAPVPF